MKPAKMGGMEGCKRVSKEHTTNKRAKNDKKTICNI